MTVQVHRIEDGWMVRWLDPSRATNHENGAPVSATTDDRCVTCWPKRGTSEWSEQVLTDGELPTPLFSVWCPQCSTTTWYASVNDGRFTHRGA